LRGAYSNWFAAGKGEEIILNGVRDEQWRILVGEDAVTMDAMVRAQPEAAYKPGFYQDLLAAGVSNQVDL